MQTRLAIIHFNALEWYPPIMNLTDFIGLQHEQVQLLVMSNKDYSNCLKEYSPRYKNIKTIRTGSKLFSKTKLKRFNYLFFYLNAFLKILFEHPDAILYFDSISAVPALLYKRYFNRKVRLLVHYHEYVTPYEYDHGMKLTKWQHGMEKKMYRNFSWISQTNEVRLHKFITDNELNNISKEVFHIMPNYPPRTWEKIKNPPILNNSKKLKLVYAGALGYENMYIKEVVEWVGSDPGLSLDILSYNIDSKARQYLDSIPYHNIRLLGGCNYQELPERFSHYDAGLVFYKPFSENTIHAVSNKVFEYAACGLDVIFSEDMNYTKHFTTKGTYPIIIGVNFNNLKKFDIYSALKKDTLEYKPSSFFCETVYNELLSCICS